jgi:GNAT superfamily N-acetyltransferase
LLELAPVEELEGLPLGASLQVQVVGRCMSPLIRSGDALLVRRCALEAIAPGDVAVVRTADRRFLAHMVLEANPLRTATLRGVADPEPLELLGRVIRVCKTGFGFPLGDLSRHLLHMLQQGYAQASHRFWLRLAVQELRKLRRDLLPAAIRKRILGPITIRALNVLDAEALRLFAGEYLTDSPDFLKQELLTRWHRRGAAVAALDGAGHWCGFAYLGAFADESFALQGFGIRSLFVVPFARGIGLEQQMVTFLCREAKRQDISPVYVNVVDANPEFVALLSELGFSRSAPELERQVASEWAKLGVVRRWATLERA